MLCVVLAFFFLLYKYSFKTQLDSYSLSQQVNKVLHVKNGASHCPHSTAVQTTVVMALLDSSSR